MGKTEIKLDSRINDAINELLLEGHFERLAALVKAKPESMATIDAGLQKFSPRWRLANKMHINFSI